MWATLFLLYAAFILFEYFSRKGKGDISRKESEREIKIFAALAIILRVILSFTSKGYQVDINCFIAWATGVAKVAPWNFYESMWCDYPPGYLYILGILGTIKKVFPSMSSTFFIALLKLPSLICDILIGLFIYKVGKKHVSYRVSGLASIMYLLNPAAILNKSIKF